MNPDVKTRWIAALRSGDFRQGTGRLAIVDGEGDRVLVTRHCCLGVLCELAVESGVVDRTESVNEAGRRFYRYGNELAYLPEPVRHWAGLNESNPVVHGMPLSIRNDSIRQPFADIADLVEEYL